MQIDNKYFLEFMTTAYFMGYIIKYIDKAHQQSICKNSVTLINDEGKPSRLYFQTQKELLKTVSNILENQDFSNSKEPVIITIFIRFGNAIICLNHKNF